MGGPEGSPLPIVRRLLPMQQDGSADDNVTGGAQSASLTMSVAQPADIHQRSRRASFFRLRYREARAHAYILCAGGWLLSLVSIALPGVMRIGGGPKWPDFIHFYTLGDIARSGPIALLYDERGQHARQMAILPWTTSDFFRPDTYPPLAALLFAPLTRLPFVVAGLVWGLLMLVIFVMCVGKVVRRSAPDSPLQDRPFVMAASLGFPSVWSMVMHGQTTIIVILAFALAWMALEARARFAAGFAIGLLALKPQFGVLIAIVAVVMGEWRLVLGTLACVAIQAGFTVLLFGTGILQLYVKTAISVLQTAHMPEIKPYLQHSLRAITSLLPPTADAILLVALSGAVAVLVIDVWRRTASWRVRMGTLVLGSVLINPHLYAYDGAVLVLAGLWLGEEAGRAEWFWQRVYWLTVAMLFPVALVIKVQISVLLMIELLVQVWMRTRAGTFPCELSGAEGPAEAGPYVLPPKAS